MMADGEPSLRGISCSERMAWLLSLVTLVEASMGARSRGAAATQMERGCPPHLGAHRVVSQACWKGCCQAVELGCCRDPRLRSGGLDAWSRPVNVGAIPYELSARFWQADLATSRPWPQQGWSRRVRREHARRRPPQGKPARLRSVLCLVRTHAKPD